MIFWIATALFTPACPLALISFLAFLLLNWKQDRLERAGNYKKAQALEVDVFNTFRISVIFLIISLLTASTMFLTTPALPVI